MRIRCPFASSTVPLVWSPMLVSIAGITSSCVRLSRGRVDGRCRSRADDYFRPLVVHAEQLDHSWYIVDSEPGENLTLDLCQDLSVHPSSCLSRSLSRAWSRSRR